MMMRTRQSGFTLVELLVVVVIAAIIMGAVVQSLVLQERTYRATGVQVRGQDGLRIALGVLESELREAATDVATHGVSLGGSDVVLAGRDSVVFRAQRNLGFVCQVNNSNDKHVHIWAINPADSFVGESIYLVFRDGNPATAADDRWIAARATSINPGATVACPGKPGTPESHTRLTLKHVNGTDFNDAVLADVLPGAPVRSMQNVTYGLYEMGDDWALRRRAQGDTLQTIVRGLAPRGEGLVFTYMDAAGNTLTGDPLGDPTQVAAIRITARTAPHPGSGASAAELTTNIFLRNN
jgi:prepilin-type N-terminal cleavage/methylation domain-containing protein